MSLNYISQVPVASRPKTLTPPESLVAIFKEVSPSNSLGADLSYNLV